MHRPLLACNKNDGYETKKAVILSEAKNLTSNAWDYS
jgi:hypothetical protein